MAPMKALIVGGEPPPVKQCHGRGREKRTVEGPHMSSWTGDPPLMHRLYWGLWESAASVKSCWRAHGKAVCAVSLHVFCVLKMFEREFLCCWSHPVKVSAALSTPGDYLKWISWNGLPRSRMNLALNGHSSLFFLFRVKKKSGLWKIGNCPGGFFVFRLEALTYSKMDADRVVLYILY